MLCCIRLLVAGTLLLGLVLPAEAVEPGEMLDDPALEARAQALDDDLRCVKCRSESIASSNAEWASDARVKVRELLVKAQPTPRCVTSSSPGTANTC